MAHADRSSRDTGDSSGIARSLAQLAAGPAGCASLAIVGILILRCEPWTFSARDVVYWSIVVGMLVLHAFDPERSAVGGGDERAATPSFDVRYALILVPAAAIVWVIVQSLKV